MGNFKFKFTGQNIISGQVILEAKYCATKSAVSSKPNKDKEDILWNMTQVQ
jgi:hypothetical protein